MHGDTARMGTLLSPHPPVQKRAACTRQSTLTGLSCVSNCSCNDVQASVVAALSRDQVFERVAPGTYALAALVRLSR